MAVLVDPDQYILKEINNLPFDYYQLYNVDSKRSKEIKDKNTKHLHLQFQIKRMIT